MLSVEPFARLRQGLSWEVPTPTLTVGGVAALRRGGRDPCLYQPVLRVDRMVLQDARSRAWLLELSDGCDALRCLPGPCVARMCQTGAVEVGCFLKCQSYSVHSLQGEALLILSVALKLLSATAVAAAAASQKEDEEKDEDEDKDEAEAAAVAAEEATSSCATTTRSGGGPSDRKSWSGHKRTRRQSLRSRSGREALVEGAAVEAFWSNAMYARPGWYPATISQLHGDGTFGVTWDDGSSLPRVAAARVRRPAGGAAAAAGGARRRSEGRDVAADPAAGARGGGTQRRRSKRQRTASDTPGVARG